MRVWHIALLAAVIVIAESYFHEVSWVDLAKRMGVLLLAFVVITLAHPVARKLDNDQPVKWTEYIIPIVVGIPGLWGIYLLIFK